MKKKSSINYLRIYIIIRSGTGKPVNKGHPREIQILVFIDKQSLFGGFFVLFNQWWMGYESAAFIYRMVFIGRWSLTQGWLYSEVQWIIVKFEWLNPETCWILWDTSFVFVLKQGIIIYIVCNVDSYFYIFIIYTEEFTNTYLAHLSTTYSWWAVSMALCLSSKISLNSFIS